MNFAGGLYLDSPNQARRIVSGGTLNTLGMREDRRQNFSDVLRGCAGTPGRYDIANDRFRVVGRKLK